jgi:hypothetical protein
MGPSWFVHIYVTVSVEPAPSIFRVEDSSYEISTRLHDVTSQKMYTSSLKYVYGDCKKNH